MALSGEECHGHNTICLNLYKQLVKLLTWSLPIIVVHLQLGDVAAEGRKATFHLFHDRPKVISKPKRDMRDQERRRHPGTQFETKALGTCMHFNPYIIYVLCDSSFAIKTLCGYLLTWWAKLFDHLRNGLLFLFKACHVGFQIDNRLARGWQRYP